MTSGGRVLCATALGDSVGNAQENAYALAAKVDWQGCFYRKDIGYRAIARERGEDQNIDRTSLFKQRLAGCSGIRGFYQTFTHEGISLCAGSGLP